MNKHNKTKSGGNAKLPNNSNTSTIEHLVCSKCGSESNRISKISLHDANTSEVVDDQNEWDNDECLDCENDSFITQEEYDEYVLMEQIRICEEIDNIRWIEALNEGAQAYEDGATLSDNPYCNNSDYCHNDDLFADAWKRGYEEAKLDDQDDSED